MNKRYVLIIAGLFLVIIVILVIYPKPKIPQAVILEDGIYCTTSIASQITDGDRRCDDTRDCIPVKCDCSLCGSIPVNLAAEQKINDVYDEECEGVPEGPVECPRFKVACIEGLCQMVEHIQLTVPQDEETCMDQDGRFRHLRRCQHSKLPPRRLWLWLLPRDGFSGLWAQPDRSILDQDWVQQHPCVGFPNRPGLASRSGDA